MALHNDHISGFAAHAHNGYSGRERQRRERAIDRLDGWFVNLGASQVGEKGLRDLRFMRKATSSRGACCIVVICRKLIDCWGGGGVERSAKLRVITPTH